MFTQREYNVHHQTKRRGKDITKILSIFLFSWNPQTVSIITAAIDLVTSYGQLEINIIKKLQISKSI